MMVILDGCGRGYFTTTIVESSYFLYVQRISKNKGSPTLRVGGPSLTETSDWNVSSSLFLSFDAGRQKMGLKETRNGVSILRCVHSRSSRDTGTQWGSNVLGFLRSDKVRSGSDLFGVTFCCLYLILGVLREGLIVWRT